ncbi:MAG: hypothetical protein ACRDPD_08130, partial [Streptosporangiaceae bacterium]
GPAWCWLTPADRTATGLGYPPSRPALARLAHIRAVLAARLWLQAAPAWTQGHAWWHSERRIRAAQPVPARAGHLPDAEVHWLTPKPVPRTARIVGALLAPDRYAQVIYLTAPATRPVLTRAAGGEGAAGVRRLEVV